MFFDFEKFCKKQTEKIKVLFKMNQQPELFTPKVIKFVDWWGWKFTPFLLTFATFLTTGWIFNRIQTKYGTEKLIIVIAIIVLFMLGGINNKLKTLTE